MNLDLDGPDPQTETGVGAIVTWAALGLYMDGSGRAPLDLLRGSGSSEVWKTAWEHNAAVLVCTPWAFIAVRGDDATPAPVSKAPVDDWKDVFELMVRTRDTVDRFLANANAPKGSWLGTLVDAECRPLMRGEALVVDLMLAELLEELGKDEWANKVRATPAEVRGKRWRIGATNSAGETVMRAVWARILAERERARLAHGVIGRRALGALQHSVRVGPNRPELVDVAGSVPALQLERGVKVATVPSSLVQGLAQERLEAALRGAGLIATAGWNALLHKGVVSSSLRQWSGEQHPGLYRFAGYAGMTEALGLSSPKHRLALPDMLEFGEIYRFDLGDGFEPAALWSHRVEKASGEGQGKRLEWNVNPWVYGADVRNLPAHADKALVFLSPQPAPMVLKASPNLSAAQWSFWWQFHAALTLRRAELFDRGEMTLDERWWDSVAEAAGWSGKQKRELLPKAIARYTADLVDQLLERVPGKPWVFTPGRSLEGVAEGLKKQEARFRGASKGGKLRAKKREERMVSGWKPKPTRQKKSESS